MVFNFEGLVEFCIEKDLIWGNTQYVLQRAQKGKAVPTGKPKDVKYWREMVKKAQVAARKKVTSRAATTATPVPAEDGGAAVRVVSAGLDDEEDDDEDDVDDEEEEVEPPRPNPIRPAIYDEPLPRGPGPERLGYGQFVQGGRVILDKVVKGVDWFVLMKAAKDIDTGFTSHISFTKLDKNLKMPPFYDRRVFFHEGSEHQSDEPQPATEAGLVFGIGMGVLDALVVEVGRVSFMQFDDLPFVGWSDVPGERTWNQENFKAWCTTTPDNERLQRIHDFVDAPPGKRLRSDVADILLRMIEVDPDKRPRIAEVIKSFGPKLVPWEDLPAVPVVELNKVKRARLA